MEQHPLEPFLPENARILMLGSFPPPQKRWSINFFYPNMQNDMWRIFGLVFFSNKDYFVDLPNKQFNKPLIEHFLKEKGVAIYDTATIVNRLQNNASDKFLDVVKATDIPSLLRKILLCKAIVTTGEKATDTLCNLFDITAPKVGSSVSFVFEHRNMHLYRMPSSSRAYPLKLEKKADYYKAMFEDVGLL